MSRFVFFQEEFFAHLFQESAVFLRFPKENTHVSEENIKEEKNENKEKHSLYLHMTNDYQNEDYNDDDDDDNYGDAQVKNDDCNDDWKPKDATHIVGLLLLLLLL